MPEDKNPQTVLSLLTCILDTVDALKNKRPFPRPLCYVPSQLRFKKGNATVLKIYSETSTSSTVLKEFDLGKLKKDVIFVCCGEECNNDQGEWLKLTKVIEGYPSSPQDHFVADGDNWLLTYSSGSKSDSQPPLVPLEDSSNLLNNWKSVVSAHYSLRFGPPPRMVPPADEAVNRLSEPPPQWGLEHDEELVRFLTQRSTPEAEHLGSISTYLDELNVSTFCEPDYVKCLTDDSTSTYWESDGDAGQHWIRLTVKKGVLIRKLYLSIDPSDDNYMPSHVEVHGGDSVDNLKKLHVIMLDTNSTDVKDICVLDEMRDFYRVIEIKIKECHEGGIDTRIHGLKIRSQRERELGPTSDMFSREHLVRYPTLEPFNREQLMRRTMALNRFMELFDRCLPYIFPQWEFTANSFSSILEVRQLLPLSKKRLNAVSMYLKESETKAPRQPKIYINRRLAAEHKEKPDRDPDFNKSVFRQIFEGLKQKERSEKPHDYRWPSSFEQWWECKFVSEGIIDQGGGFRDSLCDVGEELCPSAADVPVPLPFFIPAPNQVQFDSNVNRDTYVPNPACRLFPMYEWIGQLMGACIRSQEHIIVSLPAFVWKKLTGEEVTWTRDYATIDQAEVQTVDSLEQLEHEADWVMHGEGRTWSVTLADGSVTSLLGHEAADPVSFRERRAYCAAVRCARMAETELQVAALKRGLLRSVPTSVLDLLTWQELERRVCGSPDIPIDALKRATHYDSMEESDTCVRLLWEVMEKFENEDRSRFLRFVTGRRRLPAPLYICSADGSPSDGLPKSSTCSNTLYLPPYTQASVAEDKIRYAIYNCIAIDTDVSPWDE